MDGGCWFVWMTTTTKLQLADKFRSSLAEIQSAMNSGKERSDKLADENQKLGLKLQVGYL